MKIHNLGRQLTLIVLAIIIVLVTTAIVIKSLAERNLVNELMRIESATEMKTFTSTIDTMSDTSLALASRIAKDTDMISSMMSRDISALIRISASQVADSRSDADFLSIIDKNGNIIHRMHSDLKNDSVLAQENVRVALAGREGSYIEPTVTARLAVISSFPIIGYSGETLGVVSVGYRMDTDSFVDNIKNLTGSEATIFLEDERIATTMMSASGQRQVGTFMSQEMVEKVLKKGQSDIISMKIFESSYIANYKPLFGTDGNAIGAVFTGKNVDYVNDARLSSLIITSIVIAILAFSSCGLLAVYMDRRLTRRIAKLMHILTQVSKGNFDVYANSNSRDELGALARMAGQVVDKIKLLISELEEMTTQFNDVGDIEASIDVDKFEGAYKTVAVGINTMAHKLVAEMLMTLDCVSKIGSGDFTADIPKQIGKKIELNHAMDSLRDALQSVNREVLLLTNEAKIGNLSERAPVENYTGDWAKLMSNLNELLQEIILPINEASEVLTEVAKGNFQAEVKGSYKGEFLMIKSSINATVTNIRSYIEEISSILAAMASEDLTKDITREYIGEFSSIKNSLNTIIRKLNDMVTDMYTAADHVASGTKQVANTSYDLSLGSAEQTESVTLLNTMITTIHANTTENATNAREAESLSAKSKLSAERGDHDMKEMLTAMDGIKESSNQISNIIKVIEDIAFQTNLLALNAAVEAARAGVHGKGFAVVAEEVRNLAGRSQDAAKETSQLITESIQRVDDGTKIANETASTLQNIMKEVTKVAEIIEGISKASDTQSESISSITENISKITNVVQSNSATAEESAEASEELSSQADVLQKLISVFKTRR